MEILVGALVSCGVEMAAEQITRTLLKTETDVHEEINTIFDSTLIAHIKMMGLNEWNSQDFLLFVEQKCGDKSALDIPFTIWKEYIREFLMEASGLDVTDEWLNEYVEKVIENLLVNSKTAFYTIYKIMVSDKKRSMRK